MTSAQLTRWIKAYNAFLESRIALARVCVEFAVARQGRGSNDQPHTAT